MGTFDHFATPSAGGGRLFVAAGSSVSALTIASFPPATTTALHASANPATAGRPISLSASVAPAPDGGTVAFRSDGVAVRGCEAVTIHPDTGVAGCTTTLSSGTHALEAVYAGDASFGPSTSAPLSVPVAPAAPSLSHVRLGARRVTARAGIALRLTLSEVAQLRVSIGRLLSGHKVRRRCRAGRGHGARCTVTRRARRLSFAGKRGNNRRHLRLRGLAPGRYAVAISAVGPGGRQSRTVTVRFQIIRPRR
jgi:hypothetical protein